MLIKTFPSNYYEIAVYLKNVLEIIKVKSLDENFQCVKFEVKDKVNQYFIHYNGWNKK